MQPFFADILLDKTSTQPVYLQLADSITSLIKSGHLQAGDRLPGTRRLAETLNLHRKTIIRSYDELLSQGWLISTSGSGTFVSQHLPEIKVRRFQKNEPHKDYTSQAGFSFNTPLHLEREAINAGASLHLDDGFPDPRLAPLHDLSRAYRSQLLMGNSYNRLGYYNPQGSSWLREELSKHLNITRGLKTSSDNILITRGTTMGLFLTSSGLLIPGDTAVAGVPGWLGAEANFIQAGASSVKIGVDDYGLKIDELEHICKKQAVRLVYTTPHHHYPTTVSLRADRRIQLLHLSEKYGFIIFEDDYDYDFHFQNKPLAPLASADQRGMVLYCGSFTKTISPAFRVGYLVGSVNVIQQLSKLRRIIDRQGDSMLENAMAELLQNGIIQRHLRKSVRIYRQRRDVFCELLKNELADYVQFNKPEGGMAVWTTFDEKVNLIELALKARKKDLFFSDGQIHQGNSTRLGFASSTTTELETCVDILKSVLRA